MHELDIVILLAAVLAALGAGGVAGFYGNFLKVGKQLQEAKEESTNILNRAEGERKSLILEAKEEALRIRSGAETSLRDRRSELQRQERRLSGREENLDNRSENLDRRDKALDSRESQVETSIREAEEFRGQQLERLEAISELPVAEAKELLLQRAEEDIQYEVALRYRDAEDRAKEEANEKARLVLSLAIHRLAADVVSESSVSVVPLPSDEMKGRLIGREGRNIRALEAATGVDLIIDDTPEAVTVSCFDPVRREVARAALQKLVQDGRIHPARIEDMVEKARTEVEETIWKEGEQAALDVGVRGLSPEIIRLLGRLKYRYSYGENVLQHSIEVCQIAGMMASEIGADIEVSKMGGLLHDIGKALSHEVEGPHAEIGADVAQRQRIPAPVEHAIRAHHDDDPGTVEAFIVSAADAVSAARPGARRDTVEAYIKRLEALESTAKEFPGVEKTYAIQAGREVRILVKPDSVDDVAASKLARDIVKRIEETLAYPGQIKVTVIRETRNTEYAR